MTIRHWGEGGGGQVMDERERQTGVVQVSCFHYYTLLVCTTRYVDCQQLSRYHGFRFA